MNATILATAALLATTLSAGLGAVKPEQTNHLTGYPGRIGIQASQKPNNGGGIDGFAAKLFLAGVGVAVAAAAIKVVASRQPSSRTTLLKLTGENQPETIIEREQVPLNPSDTSSYVERAYAHFQQGDRSGAVEDLNEAIRHNPHSAYLYSERANFRQKNLGDKQGALEDYTKAIGLNPHNAMFYFWRSQTHHALGNEQKAIEDYNEAIRLAPEDTMYYCFQGTANTRKR